MVMQSRSQTMIRSYVLVKMQLVNTRDYRESFFNSPEYLAVNVVELHTEKEKYSDGSFMENIEPSMNSIKMVEQRLRAAVVSPGNRQPGCAIGGNKDDIALKSCRSWYRWQMEHTPLFVKHTSLSEQRGISMLLLRFITVAISKHLLLYGIIPYENKSKNRQRFSE